MNVLAILPGFIPSTIIGVLRPLAELERLDEIALRIRLHNVSVFLSRDIDWCDVAVFCRNCEPQDLATLYELKRNGKKIVYEVDDNFEEIPLTTDIGIHHRSFHRLHVLKRFFSLSNVTRVFSDRLLQRAVSHGALPQLTRSYFDRSIIQGLSRAASDGVIRVAYPTGRIDEPDLEDIIFSAVKTVLEKHAGKVEFHLWRKTVPRQLTCVKGVVLNKGVRSYEKFIQFFYQVGFDIGLAPGIDTPFFHSKTNNKYREFGGCGIAGIYSNLPPYSNSIVHEHSGLLVGKTSDEWVAAIERLILDERLRASIVNNAASDVFSNYSFESTVDSWRTCLFQIVPRRSDFPEWLTSGRTLPVFSIVHVGSEGGKIDRRPEYLALAGQCIPHALFENIARAEHYLKSNVRRSCCASLFFVNNETDFKILAQVISLANSAILDISAYEGDWELVCHKLRVIASSVPTSILVTSEQEKCSSLKSLPLRYVQVVAIRHASVDQEFSLSGYPAAYLDLLERHIQYAPLKMKDSGLRARTRSLADRYSTWRGRYEILVLLIKLRLGLRKF